MACGAILLALPELEDELLDELELLEELLLEELELELEELELEELELDELLEELEEDELELLEEPEFPPSAIHLSMVPEESPPAP